jgi:hypothetical protein
VSNAAAGLPLDGLDVREDGVFRSQEVELIGQQGSLTRERVPDFAAIRDDDVLRRGVASEPFADEPLANPDDLYAMGNIYPEVMQIVVRADSDIETIADLEGANVEIGPPGSGTEVAARQILEAYGREIIPAFKGAAV